MITEKQPIVTTCYPKLAWKPGRKPSTNGPRINERQRYSCIRGIFVDDLPSQVEPVIVNSENTKKRTYLGQVMITLHFAAETGMV